MDADVVGRSDTTIRDGSRTQRAFSGIYAARLVDLAQEVEIARIVHAEAFS